MKIPGLDKIYIIHYQPLKDRRVYLEKRFKELGLKEYARWIVSPKEEKFTKKELAMYEDSREAREDRERLIGRLVENISMKDIAIFIQHLRIFKMISESKSKDISMVFEDDALLDDDFSERLAIVINKLKNVKWDLCYTDKGSRLFDLPLDKKGEKVVIYKHPDRISNTTGSYLIKKESARKLVKIIKKFSQTADLEMSYVQKKNILDIYWTVPFLTRQGSIEMIYKSSVRKGSLFGIAVKVIKKIEKINPPLAKISARIADYLLKAVYKSKFLFMIKDRLKEVIGLN